MRYIWGLLTIRRGLKMFGFFRPRRRAAAGGRRYRGYVARRGY